MEKTELQQTQPLWKKYWYVVGLLLVFLLLAISFIIRQLLPPTVPENQANTWNGLTPGYSKLVDTRDTLGSPVDSNLTERGLETKFESFNDFTPNVVVSDRSGTIRFMKEFFRADKEHT